MQWMQQTQKKLGLDVESFAAALGAYPGVRVTLLKAKSGDAEAQHMLADWIRKGAYNFERNVEEASRLYLAAATSGHAGAMYQLGKCHGHGLGVDKSYELAEKYLQAAMDAGHEKAAFQLGKLLLEQCAERGEHEDNDADRERAMGLYVQAAEGGMVKAMHKLGTMYMWGGRSCLQDDDKALAWLTAAAEGDNADALCDLANVYARGKLGVDADQMRAASLLLRAAELGNAHAMWQMWMRFDQGLGMPLDLDSAVEWLQKAADAEHESAMRDLGMCLLSGKGMARDDARGVDLLLYAAEAGDVDAMEQLVRCYREGIGVEQSEERAAHWLAQITDMDMDGSLFDADLRCASSTAAGSSGSSVVEALAGLGAAGLTGAVKGAAGAGVAGEAGASWLLAVAGKGGKGTGAGCREAQYKLAHYYADNPGSHPLWECESAKWLMRAAERGHRAAMYELGLRYLEGGAGVERNYGQAFSWLEQSATLGNASAQVDLARCYLQGYGVKQDAALGIQWLRRAVDKAHPDALCEFSACCMFGLGVAKDLQRALKLADEALKQDPSSVDAKAMKGILLSLEDMDPKLRDLPQAMGYLREAADAGHHAAQYYLAVAYESGTGTEADIPAALELLKRSAHNDYAPALNRLAQLHLTGEHGVPKDPARAVKLLRRGVDMNDAESCFELGKLYETGTGVARCIADADKLYRRALEFNPKLKACAARLKGMEKRTNEQASKADAMMELLLAEEATQKVRSAGKSAAAASEQRPKGSKPASKGKKKGPVRVSQAGRRVGGAAGGVAGSTDSAEDDEEGSTACDTDGTAAGESKVPAMSSNGAVELDEPSSSGRVAEVDQEGAQQTKQQRQQQLFVSQVAQRLGDNSTGPRGAPTSRTDAAKQRHASSTLSSTQAGDADAAERRNSGKAAGGSGRSSFVLVRQHDDDHPAAPTSSKAPGKGSQHSRSATKRLSPAAIVGSADAIHAGNGMSQTPAAAATAGSHPGGMQQGGRSAPSSPAMHSVQQQQRQQQQQLHKAAAASDHSHVKQQQQQQQQQQATPSAAFHAIKSQAATSTQASQLASQQQRRQQQGHQQQQSQRQPQQQHQHAPANGAQCGRRSLEWVPVDVMRLHSAPPPPPPTTSQPPQQEQQHQQHQQQMMVKQPSVQLSSNGSRTSLEEPHAYAAASPGADHVHAPHVRTSATASPVLGPLVHRAATSQSAPLPGTAWQTSQQQQQQQQQQHSQALHSALIQPPHLDLGPPAVQRAESGPAAGAAPLKLLPVRPGSSFASGAAGTPVASSPAARQVDNPFSMPGLFNNDGVNLFASSNQKQQQQQKAQHKQHMDAVETEEGSTASSLLGGDSPNRSAAATPKAAMQAQTAFGTASYAELAAAVLPAFANGFHGSGGYANGSAAMALHSNGASASNLHSNGFAPGVHANGFSSSMHASNSLGGSGMSSMSSSALASSLYSSGAAANGVRSNGGIASTLHPSASMPAAVAAAAQQARRRSSAEGLALLQHDDHCKAVLPLACVREDGSVCGSPGGIAPCSGVQQLLEKNELLRRQLAASERERAGALRALQQWGEFAGRVKEALVCPLTHALPREPVVLADGHTYERAAAVEWLGAGHEGSPLSPCVPLAHRHVVPNVALAALVRVWAPQQHQQHQQ